jgi:hypothetical protein
MMIIKSKVSERTSSINDHESKDSKRTKKIKVGEGDLLVPKHCPFKRQPENERKNGVVGCRGECEGEHERAQMPRLVLASFLPRNWSNVV